MYNHGQNPHIHLKGVTYLSVNKKTRDTVKKAGAFVFSVLCGMLACGALTLLFSAVMYVLGLLPEIAGDSGSSRARLVRGGVYARGVCLRADKTARRP